jgi:hypothetical protein
MVVVSVKCADQPVLLTAAGTLGMRGKAEATFRR